MVTEFLPSGECVVYERTNKERKGVVSPQQLQFIKMDISDLEKDPTIRRSRKMSNARKTHSFSS